MQITFKNFPYSVCFMGELIIFNNQRVKAKGLNKSAKPDENKVKTYFFFDRAVAQTFYFERAFSIMKSHHPEYEHKIFAKLKPNGVLISDSGFQGFPLEKIAVPKN